MRHTILYVFLLCIMPLSIQSNQPQLPASLILEKSLQVDNSHIITQNVTVEQPTQDLTDCRQYNCPQKLRSCMQCQTAENYRNNLIAMDDRIARNYLLSLSFEEYEDMIRNFTEAQWQEFYQSRRPEYRLLFPSSMHFHKRILKRTYQLTLYGLLDFFNPFSDYMPSEDVSDLPKLRNKYIMKRHQNKISDADRQAFKKDFEIQRLAAYNNDN